jgi:hypothetical protein
MQRTKNHRGHKRRGHTIRHKSRAHGRVIMRGGGCECYSELNSIDHAIERKGDRILAAMESNTTKIVAAAAMDTTKIVAAMNKLNDNLVIIARNTLPGIFSA